MRTVINLKPRLQDGVLFVCAEHGIDLARMFLDILPALNVAVPDSVVLAVEKYLAVLPFGRTGLEGNPAQ